MESFWSVSLLFASYCIWQVEISYPISLPNIPIFIFLKFQCVFCVLNFSVANTIISEESCFRINVCWDIINVQRKQQGTKDSALWDTRQNWGPIWFCSVYNKDSCPVGHQTKLGPNPILLRLQQLAIVCSTEKDLSISLSSHLCRSQTVCS